MATDAITGSGYDAAASGASAASSSSAKLAKDMDTFLTMLTTQLKHQDPLSPMDSTEFTNQLVQFANVEQNIQTNKNLENLITIQNSTAASMAVGYLDQVAEVSSANLPLEKGKGQFSYALTGEAKDVTIAILDDKGTAVMAMVGETTAGKHVVQWDGKNSAGTQLPDGVYTIQITPIQATDAVVTAKTTAWGTVTGLRTENGTSYLTVGGAEVALDKIIAVTSANSLAPAA